MTSSISNIDIFQHIRILLGMVVTLGMARLLTGVARIIQHPNDVRIYPVHLAWVLALLMNLVLFWWWELRMSQIPHWTFGTYLFVVLYAITLFLTCAMLFPESLRGYDSYEDYFISRRGWFFGLLAFTCVLDPIDTYIKGDDYLNLLSTDMISNPVRFVLYVAAGISRARWFHVAVVALTLLYQASLLYRVYGTLN